jgi:Tfp pilus assembly protein PilE
MSNQPPSASIDGKQSPSSTPLPPEDPRTPLPVSQTSSSRMLGNVLVMLVIIVIVLTMIALPSCVRSGEGNRMHQMNSCIANMKQLEGAREQAIMDGKTNPCMADLCGPTAYVKETLVCPASKAVYTVPADPVATFVCPNPGISGDPECTHSFYR